MTQTEISFQSEQPFWNTVTGLIKIVCFCVFPTFKTYIYYNTTTLHFQDGFIGILCRLF